ncbi:hypothetical protein BS78_04G082700 [Paspalum vaginatum]|nr:hypothetical protein BS78_04G082700 [Paspalum vaginatum]
MPPATDAGGTSGFIESITRPATQPLLLQPQQDTSKQKGARKRTTVPARRSKRLAAIAWPRGNVQDRARQVLMKRLGFLSVAEKPDEAALQRFKDLFKGPLLPLVLQALCALCGIQTPQGLSSLQA